MLATIAIVLWLGSLALFVATFVDALVPLILRVSAWPIFAVTLLVMFLARRALTASALRGKEVLGFYKHKPFWMLLVQIVLVGLVPMLALSGPNGRANGEVCADTVNGELVELNPADCRALRVDTLRTWAGIWMTIDWLAVAQLALARRGKPQGT